MVLTLIKCFDQRRRLLRHSFYDLTDYHKIFLCWFSELVHIKMVPRKRIFLCGLAGVQTARALIDNKLLDAISLLSSISFHLIYLCGGSFVESTDIAKLLLKETSKISLVPLLPRFKKRVHQIHQRLVSWIENIET